MIQNPVVSVVEVYRFEHVMPSVGAPRAAENDVKSGRVTRAEDCVPGRGVAEAVPPR